MIFRRMKFENWNRFDLALSSAAVAAALLVGANNAIAAEDTQVEDTMAESRAQAETLKPANTVEGQATESQQDISDELITNRMARAQQVGSLSRFSFTAFVRYDGGTVKEPWSDVRPNISEAAFMPQAPQLSGSFGGRYRLTDQMNLSAQVGYFARRPFHSDPRSPNIRDRSSLQDPFVTYSYVSRILGMQSISTASTTLYTDNLARDVGYQYAWSLDQTLIQDFGGSPLSVGVYGYVGGATFDKTFTAGSDEAGQQADYNFGVIPFVEFVFNDTFNFRTVVNAFNYQHARNTPMTDWVRNAYTQSTGIGISLTRDIFLYPNVQFAPFNANVDRTNVGIQASINI